MKKAKNSDNIEEIKNKTSELSQTIQKIGEEMYKSKQDKPEQKKNEKEEDKKKSDAEEGEYKDKA